MSNEKMPHVGQVVVFHNETAQSHNALVTAVHGANCVNLVHVTQDEGRVDPYGRQTERRSSCTHKSVTPAHGNYWR